MTRLRIYFGLVLCLSLMACQSEPEIPPHVIRVGLAQMPMSLDPRFATDAASHKIQAFIHRGLVRLNQRFEAEADLASSWQHPKPLLWRFSLHPHMLFHDGTPVEAEDVAATIRAVLSKDRASPLRAGFAAVAKIEVLSKYRLEIHLNKPDASLLSRLTLGIMPKALAEGEHHARQVVGCGIFRLQGWQANQLVIERVSSHAAETAVNEIRFVGVKDPVTRSLKLVSGEIDFAQNDLPPHLLPYLQRQPHLQVQSHPSTTFTYVGINLEDERLKDVRVRRALALSLDRKLLKRAIFSDLPKLAESVLSPGHWAYQKLPESAYDLVRAKALLDEAGYPMGKDGTRFHLSYRTSTNPSSLRMVTAIADAWGKIGVEVQVESMEWGGFYARIKQGDFQLFSLSWVGITDPDIYRWILHSEMWPPHGANRGRYSSEIMDQWLDQAAGLEDKREQAAIYGKVQQKMADDQVYIPLWYRPVTAVSNRALRGYKPQADGGFLGLAQSRISRSPAVDRK
ncbi:MAG: ABC transporter substrate-binding protein [Mariprofundaceae bacterium]